MAILQEREKSFQRLHSFLIKTREKCTAKYAPYGRPACIHLLLEIMSTAALLERFESADWHLKDR